MRRVNHAGAEVSLLGGPALVALASAGTLIAPGLSRRARTASIVALLGGGAAGLYDDVREHRHAPGKGLRGHLDALVSGNLTSGAVKAVGLAATGVGVARMLFRPPVDVFLGAAIVAGEAHLANLFDLRPGRCLKFALLRAALPPGPGSTGPSVAVATMLPLDLRERTMLGDCGANALGAALGAAALVRLRSRAGRIAHLATVLSVIVAGERRSFSDVIAADPVLSWLDALGRPAQ
jgi:UDP-N-acetylmuramyl pentapeptide phosphotransferase/UDP-N-acetylglucosamine-1-phosphate transferase